jgi:Fe-S oxidoreductase
MFRKQADYSLKPFNAQLKEFEPLKTGAIHIIDIITDTATEDKLLKIVPSKIKGNSILLYTGCYNDEARIESLKKIFKIMGAEVNIFNDCCGGEKLQNMTPVHSKRIENANIADNFFKLINKKADETNSDYIVTICSMCEKNIDDGMKLSDLDIFAPVIGLVEFIGFILDIEGCGEILNNILSCGVKPENAKLEEYRI